jgi:hypothetical protein
MNDLVWAINPSLKSDDQKSLPVRFKVELHPMAAAHTCENYDGHHKLGTVWIDFDDMAWEVNVADLNNIQWAE